MSRYAQSFMSGLSEEQRNAALAFDAPVMIIAGAGSGKTRTLVGRFIHLVTPRDSGGLGADPSSIMMVTFTNKAAREMRERILPVIQELAAENQNMRGEPWIGTFHGLSLRILRVEAARAGLGKNFSIFDEADARSLATDVVETMGLASFDVDTFFRDLEIAKARLLSPQLLSAKFSEMTINEIRGTPPDQILLRWKRVLETFQTPGFVEIYAAYQRGLEEQNAVDFSDLMNRVTTLFRENPDIRDSWRSTFRHFMVDEVQDINHAQVAWMEALSAGCREIPIPENATGGAYSEASHGLHEINAYRLRAFPRATVAFVGDDDQSIYGFRGSDVKVMRSLDRKFENLNLRFLRQSYRCQPAILSVANTLVSNNTGRFEKVLEPADAARTRRRISIHKEYTPENEIKSIISDARDHIASGGDPSEFGILLRTRDMVRVIARDIRAAGLPVSEGKASDIRKSAEVRDAMAYASFLVNPDAEVHLRRIINKPSRGLGPTSTGRVARNAKSKTISFIQELRSVMNGRIDLPDGAEPYNKAFIGKAKEFGTLIVRLRSEIKEAPDAGQAMLRILEDSGYLTSLKADAVRSAGLPANHPIMDLPPAAFLQNLVAQAGTNKKSNNPEKTLLSEGDFIEQDTMLDRASHLSETARRIGNLSILLDQASVHKTLDGFLQEATLDMDQAEAQAGIQVMTIHGSKGLEFEKVRLPFWINGVMPHSRAEEEGDSALEEERRLAYVAITRAKEDLVISYPERIFGCAFIRLRNSAPSPFIAEIQQAPAGDVHLKKIWASSNQTYQKKQSMPPPAPRSEPGLSHFLSSGRTGPDRGKSVEETDFPAPF